MKTFGVLDFFTDIRNFFRGGSILGIDIGTASIKIVELVKTGENFTLRNYGILGTKQYLNHPNQAIQTSSLHIEEDSTANLLKTLLKEMKPKTKLAITSIPLFSVFSTIIEIPFFAFNETNKIIMFQAQQHIPIPINDVLVEWYPIEEFEYQGGQKYQRVLLIGIPKEIIKRYKSIFKSAGLSLLSMELEGFSLMRSLKKFFTDIPTLLIDIGAQSTSVYISESGNIKYMSQTDYSGAYLTQALSRSLDISIVRAEELKKQKGLVSGIEDSELSTLLLPFLDVIIQEVRRVKDLYERQYKKNVEKIMFVGGGVNLPGLEEYMSREFKLSPAHQSLLLGINYPKEIEAITRILNNELATAFGLAKKYFS